MCLEVFAFMHDGKKRVLKPMIDSAITIEMPISEKKVVQKLNSKLRTVSFQGGEDDTAVLTSNVPKKTCILDIVDEKARGVHQLKLRRGKDGKMWMVCGPEFAAVADRACNLEPNQMHLSAIREHKLCDRRVIREPEEVKPTFRTPPDWIRIGSIDICFMVECLMQFN